MRFFPKKTTLGWKGVAFVWFVSTLLITTLVWAQGLSSKPQFEVKSYRHCYWKHVPHWGQDPRTTRKHTVWLNDWEKVCVTRVYLSPTN